MSHRQAHALRRTLQREPVPYRLHRQRFFADHLNPD